MCTHKMLHNLIYILSDEFPWQISLKNLGRHICGGSIVNKNQVITAAHCVEQFQFLDKVSIFKMLKNIRLNFRNVVV